MFVFLTNILFCVSAYAGPCAMCKFALNSGASGGLTKGFYWSILLIAGVPFIISISVFIYLSSAARKQRMRFHD